MIESDRKQFAEALNQLFAIYGDEVTNRMRDAWWGVLEPYCMPAVLAAMNLHAGDVKRGMYRPTPADVRLHLEVTMPELMQSRRAAIIRSSRERIAPHRERIEQLTHDVKIGAREADEVADEIRVARQAIGDVLREPDVLLATQPAAPLIEAEIAPRDRLPSLVRRGIGWLGKRR